MRQTATNKREWANNTEVLQKSVNLHIMNVWQKNAKNSSKTDIKAGLGLIYQTTA
jgi:hypothetical protein